MIRSLFWLAVGAAGALEADRMLDKVRDRIRPSNVTSKMLDRVNSKLEQKQGSPAR
jgi:hypothetical protein